MNTLAEIEVLLDEGYDDQEVASTLGISLATLREHLCAASTPYHLTPGPILPAPNGERLQRLSWEGKRERMAQAMAYLRERHWDELGAYEQGRFLALADFALRALQQVETDQHVLTQRPPKR